MLAGNNPVSLEAGEILFAGSFLSSNQECCIFQQTAYTLCAGVRVDTWVETGAEVTPYYDSLIGKLMVHGIDRKDAIRKMLTALGNTRLGGIPTNLEYHKTILSSEGFKSGFPTAVNRLLALCANVACRSPFMLYEGNVHL